MSNTIITGEPNEFVREIHTRMPVILPEEHHDAWLSGGAGKEVLIPFPAERMKAWPVSARVNSPKNNDPELVTPIETESVARPERTSDDDQQDEELIHGACIPSGRLFASIPGGFDGGVVCFRVYLEQLALALKLTKPALQLLVVHVLKRTKQLLASHWLVLLNPRQQLRLSALFHSFLPFACVTSRGHSAALEKPTKCLIKVRSISVRRSMRLKSPPN